MKIINYGHACFKIIGKDFNLLFDPYKDNSVLNLKLPKVDANALFISHEHHDHNGRENVNITNHIDVKFDVINCFHDKENGKVRGNNKIHIVEVDGFKIAHFGDIGDVNIDLKKLYDIDIALIPINGFYTIGAIEAIELCKKINAKIVIPMHFYDKNNKTGYEDGDQIDILCSEIVDVKEIENDEFEFRKGDKGYYVFKKARQ